jgi:hypothetical protein
MRNYAAARAHVDACHDLFAKQAPAASVLQYVFRIESTLLVCEVRHTQRKRGGREGERTR